MSSWLYVCTKCGHSFEGEALVGSCPGCGGSSWACRLSGISAKTTPRLPSESACNAPEQRSRGSRRCNNIQGSVFTHTASIVTDRPEGTQANQRKRTGPGKPRAVIPLERVRQMAAQGMSLRAIAEELDVSHMTIQRILR